MLRKAVFILLIISSPILLKAQRFSLGGGLAMNSFTETLGLNLRGYYLLSDNLRFGPEATRYTNKRNVSYYDRLDAFHFNIHYVITPLAKNEKLGIYFLTGVNYCYYSLESLGPATLGVSQAIRIKQIGANLGAGFQYSFNDRLMLYAEYKYLFQYYNMSAGNVGLTFTFGKRTKE